ncbi:MAG: polymer-forming cytoskeletal protein [Patescibacteria group bacterium]
MKNFNKVLVVLALFVFVFPVLVSAAEFRAGQQSAFTSGEKTEGNLYMAGGTVISAGSVDKDLLVAGGTALISGPIAGDLFVVGGNITILSQVSGDMRVGGGNITVNGDVVGDVLVGGGQLILSGKLIGGDAVMAGGTVRMDSEVKGSVKIAGGKVYVNAPIGGNVDIKAGNLTLGPDADIKGNLKYESPNPVVIEEGGKVRGETVFTQLKGSEGMKKDTRKGIFGFFTLMLLAKFVMLLVAALIVGLMFRRYSKELVEKATTNPLKELGRGVVTFIVLPVLSIILLVSVIGIPLGILGLLSFVMLCIYAAIITPIVMGTLVYKWIFKKSDYIINWKTILLGTIVYVLLGAIPFLGWIVTSIAVAITLGAALNIKWQVVKEWK